MCGSYINALDPVSDRCEGSLTRDIIQQHHTISSPEVGLGDGAEPLLARGVPQLDGNVAIIHPDCLHLEVNTKGGAQVGHEDSLGDSVDEGCLANSGITSKNHLVGSVRRASGLKITKFAEVLRPFPLQNT